MAISSFNKRCKVKVNDIWPVSTKLYQNRGIGADWESPAYGFGRWAIYWGDDGKLHLSTECMDGGTNRTFSKAILENILVDAIVDD